MGPKGAGSATSESKVVDQELPGAGRPVVLVKRAARPPLHRIRAVSFVPIEPTPRPASDSSDRVHEMRNSSPFYRQPRNSDGGLPPRRPFRWLARRFLRKK